MPVPVPFIGIHRGAIPATTRLALTKKPKLSGRKPSIYFNDELKSSTVQPIEVLNYSIGVIPVERCVLDYAKGPPKRADESKLNPRPPQQGSMHLVLTPTAAVSPAAWSPIALLLQNPTNLLNRLFKPLNLLLTLFGLFLFGPIVTGPLNFPKAQPRRTPVPKLPPYPTKLRLSRVVERASFLIQLLTPHIVFKLNLILQLFTLGLLTLKLLTLLGPLRLLGLPSLKQLFPNEFLIRFLVLTSYLLRFTATLTSPTPVLVPVFFIRNPIPVFTAR